GVRRALVPLHGALPSRPPGRDLPGRREPGALPGPRASRVPVLLRGGPGGRAPALVGRAARDASGRGPAVRLGGGARPREPPGPALRAVLVRRRPAGLLAVGQQAAVLRPPRPAARRAPARGVLGRGPRPGRWTRAERRRQALGCA